MLIVFDKIEGFQWDKGNIDKNLRKHGVTNLESEQIFFNDPLIVSSDTVHSTGEEKRFYALGRTDNEKYLTVVFTLRENLIRIISARKMSKKEKEIYNEKT
ncbi:MAG: BrnT family toxin [Ignavibacteria bacterium]|nr:BrnT family toxin [Ignavibacteria bacterium]